MDGNTMTREQRVLAAIRLDPYDRVPVSPLLTIDYPLLHKTKRGGSAIDQKNTLTEAFRATFELFDEVGGWDATCLNLTGPVTPGNSLPTAFIYGETMMRYPGADSRIATDSSCQFEEQAILGFDDYDKIIKLGWRGFVRKHDKQGERPGFRSRSFFANQEAAVSWSKTRVDQYCGFRDTWHNLRVPVIAGLLLTDPQMFLSLLRTLSQFTLDLYRHGDRAKIVLDVVTDDIIDESLVAMYAAGGPSPTGIPGIMMACERGSGQYLNLKMFEQFVWPYIKKMVLAWHAAGYVTTLHFDTNWVSNLSYLLELPKGSCICELDSTTDIFRAKDILKSHM